MSTPDYMSISAGLSESPRDLFGQPFHRPGRRVDLPSGARYYIDRDGTRLPSVTTIIEAGIPKPALVRWAAKAAAEFAVENIETVAQLAARDPIAAAKAIKSAPWNTLERAGNEGTLIHSYAEAHYLGTELPEIPPHLKGKVDAFQGFIDDFNPLLRGSELQLVNRFHGYAGTCDFIADIQGETGLIDIKTSKAIYLDHVIQLAAYRHAQVIVGFDGSDIPMPPIDFCAVLHLTDGGFDLVPVDAGPSAFQVFLSARRVAGWLDKADVIGDPITPNERRRP